MTNIINLADRRPPAPERESRFTRLARWSDDALCTLVVAAGLCGVVLLPDRVIEWLIPGLPRYVSTFTIGVPGVLVGIWAALSMRRLQRRSPGSCSINVHVFEDEVAGTCKCGATGDVDGDGAA